MKSTPNYYKVLGIDKTASKKEIRSAYIAKAKEAHPDADGGSDEKFKEIKTAYDVLLNDYTRMQHDLGVEIKSDTYDGYVNRYMFYGIYFPQLPGEEDDKQIEDMNRRLDVIISLLIDKAKWTEDFIPWEY